MPNGVIPSWIPVPPVVGVTYTSPDQTLAVVFDGEKFVAVPPSDILSLADAIAIRDAVDADAAAAAASEAVASAAAISALDFPDGQVVAYYNALKAIERKCTQVFKFADEEYGYYDLATLTFKNSVVADALSVVRASTATVNHPQGLVTYPTNGLRITYDPVTGERLGALVERGATNLLLHSQYTAASGETPPTGWTIGVNTGTTTTAASPRFAGAIRATQSASNAREFYSQSVTLAASTTYTLSAWLGDGTLANGNIILVQSSGGDSPTGSTSFSSVGAITSGVYSITFTTGVVGGLYAMRVGVGCNANATGTVIHETPQLTATAFPVSYSPTTTATATRDADNVSSALGITNSNEGTLLCKFRCSGLTSDGLTKPIIKINDSGNTAGRGFGLQLSGTNVIQAAIAGPVNNATVSSGITAVSDTFYKVAIRFNSVADTISICVNGGAVTQIAQLADIAGFNTHLHLQGGTAITGTFGSRPTIIAEHQTDPRALTDAEMISWSRLA